MKNKINYSSRSKEWKMLGGPASEIQAEKCHSVTHLIAWVAAHGELNGKATDQINTHVQNA
jgi:hypothetical protein